MTEDIAVAAGSERETIGKFLQTSMLALDDKPSGKAIPGGLQLVHLD